MAGISLRQALVGLCLIAFSMDFTTLCAGETRVAKPTSNFDSVTSMQNHRRERLLDELRSHNTIYRRRVAQELAMMQARVPGLQKEITDSWNADRSPDSQMQIAAALSDLGSPDVSRLELLLADDKADVEARRLSLVVLGRMGKRASHSEKTIRSFLTNPSPADPLATTALVVLEEIGATSGSQRERIAHSLRTPAEAQELLGIIAETRASFGPDETIVKQMASLLDQADRNSAVLIEIGIGLLGNGSKPGRDALERRLASQKEAPRDGVADLVLPFCIYKAAKGHGGRLWDALSNVGRAELSHVEIGETILVSDCLLTQSDVDDIVACLRDDSPQVVCGALRMVRAIGMRAREAKPALFWFLDSGSSASAEIRADAALALAAVGCVSDMPRLHTLFDVETTPNVRDTIRYCLLCIGLGESPWPEVSR